MSKAYIFSKFQIYPIFLYKKSEISNISSIIFNTLVRVYKGGSPEKKMISFGHCPDKNGKKPFFCQENVPNINIGLVQSELKI